MKIKLDEKRTFFISNFAIDGAKRMRQIILDLLAYSRASKPNGRKRRGRLTSSTRVSTVT